MTYPMEQVTATSANLKELSVIKAAGHPVHLYRKAGRCNVTLGDYPDTTETRLLLQKYHSRETIDAVPLRTFIQVYAELNYESRRLTMEAY